MEHYRASFLSGQYRNWWRWRYGSNIYYTPNVYALGYVINSTARLKSGNYLYTGELMDTYVKRFYNPNITNAASRKITGSTPRELFDEGMQMYSDMWRKDYETMQRTMIYGQSVTFDELLAEIRQLNRCISELPYQK